VKYKFWQFWKWKATKTAELEEAMKRTTDEYDYTVWNLVYKRRAVPEGDWVEATIHQLRTKKGEGNPLNAGWFVQFHRALDKHSRNRKIVERIWNYQDESTGYTALHYLASNTYWMNHKYDPCPHTLRLLLDDVGGFSRGKHRFDMNAKDNHGRTPLHLAIELGTKVADTLIVRGWGINRDQEDEIGRTPLHVALQHERKQLVRKLLEMGVDINKAIKKDLWTRPAAAVGKELKLGDYKKMCSFLKVVQAEIEEQERKKEEEEKEREAAAEREQQRKRNVQQKQASSGSSSSRYKSQSSSGAIAMATVLF